MKSKRYDMGGSLQSLLPLLDLAAPGLGTAASTVAGVLQQANAFNKQTTPLKSPTNPFRSYRAGGLIKVGNNEFDPKDIRASKKGNYFIGKDKNTGESFGLVVEDGKYRYKKSTDKSNLNVTTGKDYESAKPIQPTTNEDLKQIQDNTAKYYRELYNSDFYKRNQSESVRSKNLNKLNKYDKGELLSDPALLPTASVSRVFLPEEKKRGTILINPDAAKTDPYYKGLDKRNTMTHEFSHVIGETKKDLDLIDSKLNRSNFRDAHDELPEEMKADIDALRRSMKDNGVWDMKSNFNQQHIDNYRKQKPDNFMFKRVKLLTNSDSDMINLLNSVSYVDDKPELPMAKKGGLLPQLKFGGSLKEHNLPTHEQGGGLVDKMGNPDSSGVAEIEKQESIYTSQKGKTPYVFSDTLVDSNGKTFSQNAKSVEKKFSGKDQISKTTHKKLMDELMAKNEIAKKMQEQVETPEVTQMPNGGELTLNNPLLPSLGQFQYPNVKVPGQLQPIQQTETLVQDMTPTTTGTVITGQNTTPSLDLKLTPSGNPLTKNPLGSLDLGKVGGILKGVALAGSAIDAFQKPEQEQLRVPDFSKGDKAYAGLGGSFDPIRNDIVQQAKSGENQIMQSAGNFGQVMSRLNALQAGVGRNLAQVGLQEKQYNDQIRMSKGQREDNKAQVIASEQIRKQTADSQNKAMGQDLVANLLQNVNNYGTEFMKQDVLTKTLAAQDVATQRAFLNQLRMMNIKNPNFQIDEKLINSDNPLSAIKFIDNGSK